MLINSDFITPAELTGYVRAGANDRAEQQQTLANFLPDRPVDDLDYRFTRGGEGLVEAAAYRSYDTEADVTARPGVTRVQGSLPPISRKIRFGEYDRLRQRAVDDTNITDGLLSDADRLVQQIQVRLEVARGQALQTGRFSISERDLHLDADFGRRPDHAVAAATAWTDLAASTPLSDLLAWSEVYAENNGQDPGVILMSRKTQGLLLRNEEIRQLSANQHGTPAVVSVSNLASVLSAHGLPPIRLYDRKAKVEGATKRVIEDGKVLLLPSPVGAGDWQGTQLGATLWGTTAEAMDPGFGIEQAERPGIVAGVYRTEDPIALWTKASAIGMPVMANPDLSFVATVA